MDKQKAPSDAAKRIKQLRANAGLTQTRLTELLGVSPAAVSQWESNTSKPSAKYWRRVARAEALGIHALTEFAHQVAGALHLCLVCQPLGCCRLHHFSDRALLGAGVSPSNEHLLALGGQVFEEAAQSRSPAKGT